MTNHPTQAGRTATLTADLVGDDAGLVERLLSAFAGGLVEVPDKANPRGYTIQYLPAIAMQSALRTCGLDEATAQIAKLQARVAQIDAIAAKLAGGLAEAERRFQSLESSCGRRVYIQSRARIGAAAVRQALTEYKDATDAMLEARKAKP